MPPYERTNVQSNARRKNANVIQVFMLYCIKKWHKVKVMTYEGTYLLSKVKKKRLNKQDERQEVKLTR